MTYDDTRTGIMHALVERLAHERLPRLLNIKERVDAGETLTEDDLDFLQKSLGDAQDNAHFYKDYPQYHDIAVKVVAIYHDVVARALENEKQRGG